MLLLCCWCELCQQYNSCLLYMLWFLCISASCAFLLLISQEGLEWGVLGGVDWWMSGCLSILWAILYAQKPAGFPSGSVCCLRLSMSVSLSLLTCVTGSYCNRSELASQVRSWANWERAVGCRERRLALNRVYCVRLNRECGRTMADRSNSPTVRIPEGQSLNGQISWKNFKRSKVVKGLTLNLKP